MQNLYTERSSLSCNAHTLEESLIWLSNTHQRVKFTAVTKAVKPVAALTHVRLPAIGFRPLKGSHVAKTAVKTDPYVFAPVAVNAISTLNGANNNIGRLSSFRPSTSAGLGRSHNKLHALKSGELLMKRLDVLDFTRRYVTASETSESPIEQVFQMLLMKYLHPEAQLVPQASLVTRRGTFRADFLLTTATGVRLVLECDGKDFHDELRDGFRDAFTLASKCADYVYRFPGSVITRKIWHALFALYFQQPGVFSEFGEKEIISRCRHLTDPEVLIDDTRLAHPPESLQITDRLPTEGYFETPSVITVRAGVRDRGASLFGVDLIEFTRRHPDLTIDELVLAVRGKQHFPA